jgi:hypothetical protein
MSLTLILALQAAAAHPAPVLAPIDFDLARLRPVEFGLGRCGRADPSAIIVCGRRSRGAYPLGDMAAIFEPRPIRAEAGFGGNLIGRVFGQSVELDRGAVSNRAMIGIRLPF